MPPNAAGEAARAGELGRGLAVVAGELRSLAQRSAEAARLSEAVRVARLAVAWAPPRPGPRANGARRPGPGSP